MHNTMYVGADLRSPGNDADTHSSRSPASERRRSADLTRLTLEMGSPSFLHTWLALSRSSGANNRTILSRETDASTSVSWSSSNMFCRFLPNLRMREGCVDKDALCHCVVMVSVTVLYGE